MISKSAYRTKEELEKIKANNHKNYWPTDLLHINAHCGIRPNSIHVLMGPTGSSKSTLAWRVAVDNAKAGANVLFWASEDTYDDVVEGLSHITNSKSILDKIFVVSEHDVISGLDKIKKELIPTHLFMKMYHEIEARGIDQIYIDNLTTSQMYADLKPENQSQMAMIISHASRKLGKSFYVVMHTRKGITNDTPRPITVTDIAGSETLPRVSQFIYIIQQFAIKDKKYNTLKIAKNRGFEITDNHYILHYHKKRIVQDTKIGFNLFLDLFQKRQRLYENFTPSQEDILLMPFLTAAEMFENDREQKEKVIEIKTFKKRVENRNLLD